MNLPHRSSATRLPRVCLVILPIALSFACPLAVHAAEKAPPAKPAAPATVEKETGKSAAGPADTAISLFDGKTLEGWKKSDFPASGKITVEDGKILLGLGYMTGITMTNEVPRNNYEVSLEAMRVVGGDFFCGFTFPVGEDPCSLIVGGWGGGLVGLSCLDYMDAANNETAQFLEFENKKWYKVRVRVKKPVIQAWIDDKKLIDVNTTDRKVSIRMECEPSLPFGIATWSTGAALRNLKLRHL